MVVDCDHPLIHNCDGDSTPDFGINTTMDYDPMGAPGAFGMLNLDGGNQNPGASEEADWILHGFDKYLGLGNYRSDPGREVLVPEHSGRARRPQGHGPALSRCSGRSSGTGQNAVYEIIGWIGFHLTSFRGARQQRHAARLFHGIHRPGNPGLERRRRLGTLKFLRREVDSTHRIGL